MGLLILIAGLALFLGVHTLTTLRGQRAAVIARLGEGGYKILYTLVSFVGLALIVWGFSRYRATEWVNVWYPPVAMRHIALALMLPAVILVVASYIRGNIYLKLKHPMLAGVKLWAVLHLMANGDLGSIILFGSVLVDAVLELDLLIAAVASDLCKIERGDVNQAIKRANRNLVSLLAEFHLRDWCSICIR